ncbi:putative SAM-dependent methyltransferase [Cladorrhinum sp. PSN332]|nr:putative SAM-dependent methyltransferase [Cladorrhinum sp. PSN332]
MCPPSKQVLPLSSAPKISSYHIQPPTGPSQTSQAIELSQATHRINLINSFGPRAIFPSAQILELGCGQGTCTAVLAEAVTISSTGPGGHVTALDPAPGTYGAPFTLSQAQAHLTSSLAVPENIRKAITFHLETDLASFLHGRENLSREWDAAVLAHCIWYFPSPEKQLESILLALKGRAKRVCVAEYALQASSSSSSSSLAAMPHVLAALARATLEANKRNENRGSSEEEQQNIRGVISPEGIKKVLERTGWKLESEGIVVPDKELSDGYWETAEVVSEGFLNEVEDGVPGDDHERARSVLRASRDAVVRAVDLVPGGLKGVRTMDVWVGVFVQVGGSEA